MQLFQLHISRFTNWLVMFHGFSLKLCQCCVSLLEAKLANFVFLSIPQFHQINTRLMSTINSQKQMSYFHERMNIITQTNIIKIYLENGICKMVFFASRFIESSISTLRGSCISILSNSQKTVHIIETVKI